MQQAALGGDQRALPVDRDAAPFEDHRGAETLDVEVLGQEPADGRVAVVGMVLLAPGVEGEVGHGAGAVAAREKDRAAVAQPGIVDRHLDHVDVAAAVAAGHAALAGAGEHEHGLESGDRAGDGRIARLGQEILLAPEVAADLRRPADDAALVRLPFGRHAKTERAGRGRCGDRRREESSVAAGGMSLLLCARAVRRPAAGGLRASTVDVRLLYDQSTWGRNGAPGGFETGRSQRRADAAPPHRAALSRAGAVLD